MLFKMFRKKEVFATLIQLCVFAILIPFIGFWFSITLYDDAIKSTFLATLFNLIPYSDVIQNIALGVDAASMSISEYIGAMLSNLDQDISIMMYVGMWLTAFRVIFKELIELPGLPILQTLAGFAMGSLTITLINDPMMRIPAIFFLMVLNVVLIIITHKSLWRKVLEIIFFLPLQAYQAFLVSAWTAVVVMIYRGAFPSVLQGVTAFVTTTLLWIIYLTAHYLVVGKDK